MDERKRPASYDQDESAPPLKKQATTVNGTSTRHVDADMPWKDDLERFQKEAILRQMQEYKRERNGLEGRLTEMTKQSKYHDEHLMIIDAWFSELLDEVKVLIGDRNNHASYSPFPSALLGSDTSVFKDHLKSRSAQISSAISHIFSCAPQAAPEVVDLEARIAQLLSSEKEHLIELEKNRLEKEKLEERLEDAALRYMIAEKKLDRSKSATVAKLEKQAITGGRNDSGSGLGGSLDDANGGQADLSQGGGERLAETEAGRKEAVAESSKRKEQIMSLEEENERLTSQLTNLNIRLSHLSDDDYSKTDLFKQVKSQYEDVIKRINDLEATNIKLREEAERLQAERTTYRVEVERECETAVADKDAQLAQAENDLARIRNLRDELMADLSMRKAAQAQERTSVEQIKDLNDAKDERIRALQAETARLSSQAGNAADLQGLSAEELRARCKSLENQLSPLNAELHQMAQTCKKFSAQASQRISNLTALEEKIQRLSAEKGKADQKYFATMKVKEAREQEVRTLRAQNSKSSEMVSSLKDSETANRALQVNLEKQVVETKESVNTITIKLRTANQLLAERTILADGLKTQVEELQKSLVSKDEIATTKSTAHRTADVELEKLKVRLEETKKQLETWKVRSQGTNSEEYEMYRSVAICTVCRVNFKNTTMKTCGHVFCEKCVEERTQLRSRKCPNCNKAFGLGDVMRVTL